MIRLVQLSDIHFGAEHPRALEATAEYVKENPSDLLIISGDVTQNGDYAEFKLAADWVAGLPGRKLIVPGNHDTPYLGLIDRLFRPFQRFQNAFGQVDDVAFTGRRLQVYGVNTARGAQLRLNWSKGSISRAQTRRVVSVLTSTSPDTLKILVAHHPLSEVEGTPMTGRVRGGSHAVKRLAAANVDLILTGHVHMPFVQPFFLLGDGRTYAIGASTLSMRTRGAPPGFNRIEVDAQTINVTAIGWTGMRLEPQEVWSLPRRDIKISGN